MNKNANYTIEQVYNVDESLAMDCYYVAAETVGDADCFLHALPEHVSVRRQPLFVARKNNYVVGFLQGKINRNTGDAYIASLYVSRAAGRCGLGRALVQNMERLARDSGSREISLMSRPAAVGFYERLGYARDVASAVRNAAYSHSMRKTL